MIAAPLGRFTSSLPCFYVFVFLPIIINNEAGHWPVLIQKEFSHRLLKHIQYLCDQTIHMIKFFEICSLVPCTKRYITLSFRSWILSSKFKMSRSLPVVLLCAWSKRLCPEAIRSRGSLVSIVTRLQAGQPGFDSQQRQGRDFFSSPPRLDRQWGPHSLPSNGYQGLSPGGKADGHEADHSPPSNVEVKNAWRYTSTPPYVFAVWYFKYAQRQRYLYLPGLS
jgi:hypothetical protein